MAYNWKKFMHGLENYGLAMADTSLSTLGASNVIKPEMYMGENKDKWAKTGDIMGGISQAVVPLAMNIVAPGSGQILSGVQKGVGAATSGSKNPTNYAELAKTGSMIGENIGNFGIPTMPYGGTTQADTELEKQEVLRTPQGQIRQVDAPIHSQGGTGAMNLPSGTNVLSDRLKSKTGKTFAEEGAKYNTEKWEKILKSSTDPFQKKTAEKMIEFSNRKLTKLYAEQELVKGNQHAKGLMKLQRETNKMPLGGEVTTPPIPAGQHHPINTGYIVTNLYDGSGKQLFYGPNHSIVTQEQIQAKPIQKPATQVGERYSGVSGYDPLTNTRTSKMPYGGTTDPLNLQTGTTEDQMNQYYNNVNPEFNAMQMMQYGLNANLQGNNNNIPPNTFVGPQDPNGEYQYRTEPLNNSNKSTGGIGAGAGNVASKSGEPNSNNPLGAINPYFTAATAGNFMGSLYDIYRGAKGPDEVNFERINPELVDYSASRRMATQETNRGFNNTKKAIQEGTDGNAGAYLTNIGSAGVQRDRLNQNMISQSYENQNNTNAQIKNNAKGANAQIQMQESIARQQEKDIAKNTLSTGLYNFGAALNTYGNDMQLKGNEPVLKALIATGDYDYVYDKRGKPIGINAKASNKTTYFEGLTKQQIKEKEALEANLPK